MSELRKRLTEEYIQANMENARLCDFRRPDSGLSFYTAEELQTVEGDWFPLCALRGEDGALRYGGREGIVHTYVEGQTGVGKTTRYVMQAVRALSSMKEKPSFVLNDMHGEIIANLYHHLKENGYDIKILNCNTPSRSDTYNPLGTLGEDSVARGELDDTAMEGIRKLAEIIQPIESHDDPIWDRGARAYTHGCLLDKFEDAVNGDLPLCCLNLYNVIQNHYWLREHMTGSGYSNMCNILDLDHYKKKGSSALSVQKIISTTNNAEKTRASYFGVVENHYDILGQPGLYRLSSSGNIRVADILARPTAVVIQSTSLIGDALVSMLLNDIYTHANRLWNENGNRRMARPLHCFLDEFANCHIADGKEFIRMLTTSRKFGMYWHMILQCDAQLDRKFDPETARIIRANCAEVYFGSHDHETAVRFATSCGNRTVESLASLMTPDAPPSFVTAPLVTPDELTCLAPGYFYLRADRHAPLFSYFEAFYACPEFVPVTDTDSIYPHNDYDYRKTAFFPTDIPPRLTQEEYDMLCRVRAGYDTLTALKKVVGRDLVIPFLHSLVDKGVLKLLPETRVGVALREEQMMLYPARVTAEAEEAPQKEDDEDEDDPFRFRRERPAARDKTLAMIEEWAGKDPLAGRFCEAESGETVAAVAAHVDACRAFMKIDMLSELTLLPEALLQVIRYYYDGGGGREAVLPYMEELEGEHLKFEILETYIGAHNYRSKTLWDEQMAHEFVALRDARLLPRDLLRTVESAVDELREELTLANIREIKKLIAKEE